MAAGSIPDITPYFAGTYKAGAEAAQLQVRADLERELARERAASQMAQTLVGGAFTLGGQLGSAALSHYLSEPLKAVKAGIPDFEGAYGTTRREAYLDLIEPQLRLAAEARAAEETKGLVDTPEPLREFKAGADWDDFDVVNEGLKAKGLEPLSEEEFPAVITSKKLRVYEGGPTDIRQVRQAATERHLERMKSVVRAGGSVSSELKELKLEVPSYKRFIQDPRKLGKRALSSKAGAYYAAAQRNKSQKELEILDLINKTDVRNIKVRQTALVNAQKLVAQTDTANMTSQGLAARGFPDFKYMLATELSANYGIAESVDKRTGEKRLFLQRWVGDKYIRLRDPLSNTQIQWLNNDIAFAVAAPLTAKEYNHAHTLLYGIAIPLRKAGRNATNIYMAGYKKLNKANPPIFSYHHSTKDKTTLIDVRLDGIQSALMSQYTDENGKALGSNIERYMEWIRMPKGQSMRVGTQMLEGAGITNGVFLSTVEGRLRAIAGGAGDRESREKLAGELFGKNAPDSIKVGLQLLIRETTERIRGGAGAVLGAKAGKVTPAIAIRQNKLRAAYPTIFNKGLKEFGAVNKKADKLIYTAVDASRRASVTSARAKTITVKVAGAEYKAPGGKKYLDGYIPNKGAASAVAIFKQTPTGADAYKKLIFNMKRNAVRKHFPGHIRNFKKAAESHKLTPEQALEIFRNSFSWKEYLSDDEFMMFWNDPSATLGHMQGDGRSPGPTEDRLSRAIKAIGLMDISDKEKYRRFAHFRARMGA